MSISWGTQYPKLKTNLGLAVNRLKLLQKKKTEIALKSRKEIADYIKMHKEDRGRIRVEHIIREDFLVEAYEILEMYCDLLLARFGVIQQMKNIDEGIGEAIVSLLWAAPRVSDVPELTTISNELSKKYGKLFVEQARSNQLEAPCRVSQKLLDKMSLNAPDKVLVEKYMIEIAKYYNVEFTPDKDVMRDVDMQGFIDFLEDFRKDDKKGPGDNGNGGGRNFEGDNLIGFNSEVLKPNLSSASLDNDIYEIPYPMAPQKNDEREEGPRPTMYPTMNDSNIPIIPSAPPNYSPENFPVAPSTNKMPLAPPAEPHIYDIPPAYDLDDLKFPEPPKNFITKPNDNNSGGGHQHASNSSNNEDNKQDIDDLMKRLDNLYKKH
uniref:IST1 homolog n=1 Tax=Parastrongyloides trichosuri TaxID=131310 RepID=A0A0N4ZLU1_PARTI